MSGRCCAKAASLRDFVATPPLSKLDSPTRQMLVSLSVTTWQELRSSWAYTGVFKVSCPRVTTFSQSAAEGGFPLMPDDDDDCSALSFCLSETDQFPCLKEAEWGSVTVTGFLSLDDASLGPQTTTGESRVSPGFNDGVEPVRTLKNRSAACPGGNAPGGMVK